MRYLKIKQTAAHLNGVLQIATRMMVAVAVLLCTVACSEETSPADEETQAQTNQIVIMPDVIDVQTRATEPGQESETWFNKLVIYYFEGGICQAVDAYTQAGNAPFTTFPVKRPVPAGLEGKPLDIYVAAATEDYTPAVAAGGDVSKLYEGSNNYTRGYAHEANLIYPDKHGSADKRCVPMSGKVTHKFPDDGKVATVKLKRSLAKLRVKIMNAMPAIGTYDEDQIAFGLTNVPKVTQIIPNLEAAAEDHIAYPWVGKVEPSQVVKDLIGVKNWAGAFKEEFVSSGRLHYCYLNPNNYGRTPAIANTKKTILRMFLPYKFLVGDPAPKEYMDCYYDVPFDRPIEPNHIYELEIRVYGLGIPIGTTRTKGESSTANTRGIETRWNVKAWDE